MNSPCSLLCLSLVLFAFASGSDLYDYDDAGLFWGYGDHELHIRYKCFSYKYDIPPAFNCEYYKSSYNDDDYGCCVRFTMNETTSKQQPTSVFCPIGTTGTQCLGDTVYVKPTHIKTGEVLPRRNYESTTSFHIDDVSTIHIDRREDGGGLKSGSLVLIILGSVVGGVILLTAVCICCAKWGVCRREDDDDTELLDAPLPRRAPSRLITQGGRTYTRPRYWLTALFIFGRRRNDPTSYRPVEENEAAKNGPSPPGYYDVVNEGSSSAP